MYRDAFAALSDQTLAVTRIFAQQLLSGGEWLHAKFRQSKGLLYSPYLLTRAGSVFVLEASPEKAPDAATCVGKWRSRGLPLDPSAQSFYSLDPDRPLWEQCPFLSENGYGEVAVNQKLHQAWMPKALRQVEVV